MSVSLSKVFSAKPGWYHGDFHAHSTCSDGVFTPHELNDLAIEHGLDFLSITDHNVVRAFDDFDASLDHMILPGIEVTLREGHFIVFGFESIAEQAQEFFQSLMELPKEIRNKQSKSHAELSELMRRIKEAGLVMDIAHPLLWPWEWRDHDTDIAFFDCMELVNDPTYKPNHTANPSARRLWSAWLNAGYRITALGGTDFHTPKPADDPTRTERLNLPLTYVYARELSGHAILEGVRQRHVYVSMGPQIEFQANVGGQTYVMGDDLGQVQSGVNLFAEVDGCSGPAEAMLVKNGKIVTRVPVQEGGAKIEWQIAPDDVKEPSWYRFDVIDPEDQGLAVSNPFFFGPKLSPGSLPYGKFLGGFAKA